MKLVVLVLPGLKSVFLVERPPAFHGPDDKSFEKFEWFTPSFVEILLKVFVGLLVPFETLVIAEDSLICVLSEVVDRLLHDGLDVLLGEIVYFAFFDLFAEFVPECVNKRIIREIDVVREVVTHTWLGMPD